MATEGSGSPRPGGGDDPAGGQPVHCLVVDDDPGQRALVLRELRVPFPDLVAREAGDAVALDRGLGGRVDLVVTEYRLDWTNGFRVIKAVRARCPDAAVVMFTGAGSQEIAVDAMKAGVDDYVVKSPHHLVRLRASAVRAIDEARQRRALAAAEGRYRRLVEGIPVGLYQLGADGRILDANPAMGRLVGRAHDALVGTSKWALYRRAGDSARWQVVMVREGAVLDFETEWVRADGRVVRVRESARAVRGPDGTVRYDGAAEELTPGARDGDGRRLAPEFLASVSHELRTQLHVIVGMTQLALERPLEEEPRGFLVSAEAAAHALHARLTDLLEFTRAGAGRIATQAAAFDLRTAVHEALRALGGDTARKGLELVCHVTDATLARVVGDERRFREILVQLVGRAIEVAPSGHLSVTVGADEDGVRLEVGDAGVGIPPANQAIVFRPFVQGDGAATRGDDGTRLAVTNETSDGRIGVERDPGTRSSLTVTLPFEQDDVTARAIAPGGF